METSCSAVIVSFGTLERARQLCIDLCLPQPAPADVFGPNTLQAFIARTERVMSTTKRRVLLGEAVPNSDKLFSIFEPHTQLYKRGKAGEPIQFGRQVLVFEDAAGFIVHGTLMNRDDCDSGVAVAETKVVQSRFQNRIRRLSFDRGFHSPENAVTHFRTRTSDDSHQNVPHEPKKFIRDWTRQNPQIARTAADGWPPGRRPRTARRSFNG